MSKWGRRLVVAAIIAVTSGVGTTVWHDITAVTPQHIGSVTPLPPVEQPPLTPTDLQQVESRLGSFVVLPASNSPTPDTQFPAVLMARQDGSVDASTQWTVPFQEKQWVQQDSLQITNVSLQGDYVTFSTGPARVYTVHVNQPFVLELVPQYVMVFDGHGKQWSISTTQAIALRQHL